MQTSLDELHRQELARRTKDRESLEAQIIQLHKENAAMREAFELGKRAIAKMKREYKRLQPDAQPNECWSEVEAFENALTEALTLAEGQSDHP